MEKETNRISLYKLKSNAGFDSVDPSPHGFCLEYEDEHTKLFIHPGKSSKPHWVKYLAPLLTTSGPDIANISCSFLLLRRYNNSVYAISGGYGYSSLRDEVLEDFGLKLALRMIEETATISQRSMKGTTRQIMRVVAGYDPLFDRENYNRILNALEGRVKFEGRKFRVKGRSSIILRTERPIDHLNVVLGDIEDLMAKEEQVHFPRSYEEVQDGEVIANLEDHLLAEFVAFWSGSGSRDNLYIEFSDPLSQIRCEKFQIQYDRRKVELEEFDLSLVRDTLIEKGAKQPSEKKDIERLRVTGINEFGHEEFIEESFSKLLVYETSISSMHYIKFGKRWYKILDEVQNFLDDEIARIPVRTDLLPAWNKSEHPEEKDYNKYASLKMGCRCLDRDLIQVDGPSKIELCDIFDLGHSRFYHIKETWGSKAAYLFSQGATAAEFYRNSSSFRDRCAEKWPDLFCDTVKNPEIVFGVAHAKAIAVGFPLNLSYFAKLSLYNATSGLRSLGFEVALAPVELQS